VVFRCNRLPAPAYLLVSGRLIKFVSSRTVLSEKEFLAVVLYTIKNFLAVVLYTILGVFKIYLFIWFNIVQQFKSYL